MASTSFVINKKRKMNEGIILARTKRPIDKQIINVALAVDATQRTTDLFTFTFPGTVTGMMIDLTFAQDAGTGNGAYSWVIVQQREGTSISTISLTNAGSLYQPEQNVMMWGRGTSHRATNDTPAREYTQRTKAMRKMMGGDKLVFVTLGEATNTHLLNGAVQFFIKT